MHFFIILFVIVLSTSVEAQTCFEGSHFDSTSTEIVEIIKKQKLDVHTKMESKLFDLKLERATTADINELLNAKISRLTDLVDLQDTSYKMTAMCTPEAKLFFECVSHKEAYIEAKYVFIETRSGLDLTVPANQRRWQAIAPRLGRDIEKAYDSFSACSGNVP